MAWHRPGDKPLSETMMISLLMQICVTQPHWVEFWFCKCGTSWMFPPQTFRLFYVMFTFTTRIFYRGVPGFATDCPCSIWCLESTTCLLYVGPLFGNVVENDNGLVILTYKQLFVGFFHCFTYILMPHNVMILHFHLPYFYLNQWWLVYWCIYLSLGLSELTH